MYRLFCLATQNNMELSGGELSCKENKDASIMAHEDVDDSLYGIYAQSPFHWSTIFCELHVSDVVFAIFVQQGAGVFGAQNLGHCFGRFQALFQRVSAVGFAITTVRACYPLWGPPLSPPPSHSYPNHTLHCALNFS